MQAPLSHSRDATVLCFSVVQVSRLGLDLELGCEGFPVDAPGSTIGGWYPFPPSETPRVCYFRAGVSAWDGVLQWFAQAFRR